MKKYLVVDNERLDVTNVDNTHLRLLVNSIEAYLRVPFVCDGFENVSSILVTLIGSLDACDIKSLVDFHFHIIELKYSYDKIPKVFIEEVEEER